MATKVTNDQLVEARNAGVEFANEANQLKIQQLLAERSSPYAPFNKDNNPSAFGDDTIEDEPGTDPAEMIQLELPLESVKKLQIMAQENPEIAQSITDELMIAGNPSFDINETPATRRIRKIRTLEERGVGGEKGNAGDILKKGVQLPNLQASALDDLLSPHQNPRSGSLKDSGLTNDQIKELLIRGTKLPQA